MAPYDGDLSVIDETGQRPLTLRDEDEAEWIERLYIAAAAPSLYEALGLVLNRLEYLVDTFSSRPHADRKLIQAGHAALIDARPRPEDIERLEHRDRQTDLFAG